MEDSPLAEVYYEKLKEGSNPVPTLVSFYKALFNVRTVDKNTYSLFARLYKIYGAKLTYFALLDCTDVTNINLESPGRLISYFAKKRLESMYKDTMEIDLTSYASKMEKELNKKKRIKIPDSPFEEEEIG